MARLEMPSLAASLEALRPSAQQVPNESICVLGWPVLTCCSVHFQGFTYILHEGECCGKCLPSACEVVTGSPRGDFQSHWKNVGLGPGWVGGALAFPAWVSLLGAALALMPSVLQRVPLLPFALSRLLTLAAAANQTSARVALSLRN